MPNWTTNFVTMKGISKEKKLFTDNNFDFNKIVPEPKTKEECIAKYGEKYIDNGDKHLQHDEDNEWFDWYSWHCDFWGTKWNACETDIEDDDCVSFWTAWAEPDEIWVALSKMYPDRKISIYAEYEEGLYTESEYIDGKLNTYFEGEFDR